MGKLSKRVTTLEELARELEAAIESGFNHLMAITCVDLGGELELIYSLSSLDGRPLHLSLKVPQGSAKVSSIAALMPAASFYEREVHDLFGVHFEGNEGMGSRFLLPQCYPEEAPPPLLKSVDSAQVRELLSTLRCASPLPIHLEAPLSPESVVVPFGPYHPALKEPEHISLVVEGERIRKAFIKIGYVHRGIEKAAEARSFLRDIYLFEKVCGICSTHHAWTFVEAVESLLGLQPPPRAVFLRAIVAELERIHSHALWLGLVGYWMGFESMFMWVWGLRELVMDILEEATGNRVHKSFVTIGGVRRDIPDEKLRGYVEKLSQLRSSIASLMEDILSSEQFASRTRGIGRYTLEQARRFSTVGPVRRAAGDPYDIRKIEPYGAYDRVDFHVPVASEGDVYNLVKIRLEELLSSVDIIAQLVEKIPSGNPVPPRHFMGTVPEGEAYARTEAPRGELLYYVKADNKHNPYRVKIRTPTLANIQLAASLLEGALVSDLPLIVTSIDPCFSCMDRVTVLKDGEFFVLKLEDLVKLARGGSK
ncbi:MAG: NADH-quinone oxidoreductase subunit C [Thermofilum sp.]